MSSLENIYISPLELCNLSCLYCYTKKPKTILTNDQILQFVDNYKTILSKTPSTPLHEGGKNEVQEGLKLKSIIFCGGEVFTLKNFPKLINNLLSQGIFISIITNGTIDCLDQINDPHNCQLIVSFDGPEKIHDQNRGAGKYVLSKEFVQKALKLGFPVSIFFLVTKDSYPHFKTFRLLDFPDLPITYLTDRLGSLSKDQVKEIRANYPCYPPKDFHCNIFSLQSNGKFYGCCETTKSIGSLSDPLQQVIEKYLTLIPICNDPQFKCNL